MKKSLPIGVAALVCATLTISGCNGASNALGGLKSDTGITVTLSPEFNNSYKLLSSGGGAGQAPSYTARKNKQKDFAHYKAKFNLSGTESSTESFDIVDGGPWRLKYQKKAGIVFLQDKDYLWSPRKRNESNLDADKIERNLAVASTNLIPPIPQVVLPSDEHCVEIASSYIADNNLSEGEHPIFYQINQSIETDSVNKVETVYQKEVVFKRQINGRVIHGSGSQISVFIRDGGAIAGAFVDWPDLEEQAKMNTKGLQRALRELPGSIAQHNKRSKEPIHEFLVKRVDLDYFGAIEQDGTRTISPVYTAIGSVKRNGREVDKLFHIKAVD